MRTLGRGAQLPYRLLAGVVPCASGWVAATAKLQGITMAPEEPQVFSTFVEVLDYKPAYQVITVFAPIGLFDEAVPKGRSCEREARRLLGWPRASAIASAPPRCALLHDTYDKALAACGGHLSPIRWRQWARLREVDRAIAPYWQRTVFEVHPELSFYQLNGDRPVMFPKHSQAGISERRNLLGARISGVNRIMDASLQRVSAAQLLDAAACLWTARRIVSRAVSRLPEDPEWDGLGLRMEFIR